MSDIKINNLDINEGTYYRVKTINHADSPGTSIDSINIARRDGDAFINRSFRPKRIEIDGTVKAPNRETMEEKKDNLKKLSFEDNLVELDIPVAGETRRYEVVVTNVFIGEESFNINFAPFTIVCEAIEEPFGRDTDWTEALSVEGLGDESHIHQPEFDGSYLPLPKLRYTINTAGNLRGIHVINKNTNTRIETEFEAKDNDVLDIDTDGKEVLRNREFFSFNGMFPEFKLGENDLESIFITADSIPIAQEERDRAASLFRHLRVAQAIKSDVALEVPKIEIFAIHWTTNKVGDPDDITLRIETDDDGEPSGNLVHSDAESTIEYRPESVNQWFWYVFEFDSDINLSADTDYWIVMKEEWTAFTGTSYNLALKGENVYNDSSYDKDTLYSFDHGSTWEETSPTQPEGLSDLTFRIWDRQSAEANWDVDLDIEYKRRFL